jgi:hypothetical protein
MLLNGRCIYEIRSLQASGHLFEGDEDIAGGTVTLSERRESDPDKSMYWLITGATLKGHVTSATFRDSTDPTRALVTFDLSSSDPTKISEGAVSTRTGANVDGFFELISAGNGVIRLETDLQTQPTISLPLEVTQRQNWTRPYCS